MALSFAVSVTLPIFSPKSSFPHRILVSRETEGVVIGTDAAESEALCKWESYVNTTRSSAIADYPTPCSGSAV